MSGLTPKRVCRARGGNTRRALVFALACGLGVTGCTEHHLHEAEREALKNSAINAPLPSLTKAKTLSEAATLAEELSNAYADAARNASQSQDLFAVITFVAAASTAAGAVQGVSDEVLANRAIVGTGATIGATRMTPKAGIQEVYKGARKLNCISLAARLQGRPSGDETPYPEITVAAIRHVMLSTHGALARDPASFDTMFGNFADAIKASREELVNHQDVGAYVALIEKCLSDTATLPKT
ncbi:hypothetical protein [Pseudooceanicola sp. 200-1SW]|uniref:hypothetical protein n=1 Tax=Pseudooceanicola sp. 200-1SW TaxID=3425949 RepID=UPI003D7FEAA9